LCFPAAARKAQILGQEIYHLPRSADELRARAAQFRQMARGARMVATVPALLRLADRYEALAKQRKQEEEANQSLST
jgi:5-bromo-4-chloroindolyl phosphate hydrolysis protein